MTAKGIPSNNAIATYGGPLGSFNPAGQYLPSPEADRLLRYLEGRSGKKINVKPFSEASNIPPEMRESAYGVYFHDNPVGGSQDPASRTVYLNPAQPGNNLAILSHELGHAFDPQLPTNYEAYYSSSPARIQSLLSNSARQNPVGFLNTYMLGPEVKVRLETEAQRAATEAMQNIGYPTKQFTDDSYYKGYPGSFVETGLDQAAALYSLPRNVPKGVPSELLDMNRYKAFSSMGQGSPNFVLNRPALGPDDPEIDFSDEVTRGLLQLGLDKKYQSAENRARTRNREYIESRLGR